MPSGAEGEGEVVVGGGRSLADILREAGIDSSGRGGRRRRADEQPPDAALTGPIPVVGRRRRRAEDDEPESLVADDGDLVVPSAGAEEVGAEEVGAEESQSSGAAEEPSAGPEAEPPPGAGHEPTPPVSAPAQRHRRAEEDERATGPLEAVPVGPPSVTEAAPPAADDAVAARTDAAAAAPPEDPPPPPAVAESAEPVPPAAAPEEPSLIATSEGSAAAPAARTPDPGPSTARAVLGWLRFAGELVLAAVLGVVVYYAFSLLWELYPYVAALAAPVVLAGLVLAGQVMVRRAGRRMGLRVLTALLVVGTLLVILPAAAVLAQA